MNKFELNVSQWEQYGIKGGEARELKQSRFSERPRGRVVPVGCMLKTRALKTGLQTTREALVGKLNIN